MCLHGYVVIYRASDPYPIRHCIGLSEEYKPIAFAEWYYRVFHKFYDDVFIYCKNMIEVQELVKKLKAVACNG